MKKNLKWLGLGGILGAGLLFAMNLPAAPVDNANDPGFDDMMHTCMSKAQHACTVYADGGSEAPRGLAGDTKVELSLGEQYILVGTIKILSNGAYLQIDFRKQPWLASATRVKNPYYRIDGSSADWKKYEGKEVTIVATARYTAWQSGGETILSISLAPTSNSVL